MASRTSLYTRLDVDDDDSATSASIMLAPDGSGTVMVTTDGEPQFSVSADQLPALLRVLTECEQFRTHAQPVHLAPEPAAPIIPFPVRSAR